MRGMHAKEATTKTSSLAGAAAGRRNLVMYVHVQWHTCNGSGALFLFFQIPEVFVILGKVNISAV